MVTFIYFTNHKRKKKKKSNKLKITKTQKVKGFLELSHFNANHINNFTTSSS